jgi:hypothetical protein
MRDMAGAKACATGAPEHSASMRHALLRNLARLKPAQRANARGALDLASPARRKLARLHAVGEALTFPWRNVASRPKKKQPSNRLAGSELRHDLDWFWKICVVNVLKPVRF